MFVPSGNLKPKKYSPPSAAAIFSSSSCVNVSRLYFWLKFEGVILIALASAACDIPLYAIAILIFCEMVIVALLLYQDDSIIKKGINIVKQFLYII